jgi:chromosome partitioning protein
MSQAMVPMSEVVSVVHTKGGAGKSSLTTNLAFALSCLLYRVLVIDLDRQGGQSVGFGISGLRRKAAGQQLDVGSVLRGEAGIRDAIVTDVYPGLDVLPAEEGSLIAAERELGRMGIDGQVRLHEILHDARLSTSPDRPGWDIVLIDTPGRHTDIVGVALTASTGVLIPAIPESGPVAELSTVFRHIAEMQAVLGTLDIYGVVKMRIGGTSKYRFLAEEQTKEIAQSFGVPVFRNKVPEDARFGESHLAREPIGVYSSTSRSALAFRCIADELASRRGWPRPGAAPTFPESWLQGIDPAKSRTRPPTAAIAGDPGANETISSVSAGDASAGRFPTDLTRV